MKLQRREASTPTSARPAFSGLAFSDSDILYRIDADGTTLGFRIPPLTLDTSEFFMQGPRDYRPFINIRSRSDFRFDTPGQRGTCEFYTSGWYLYSRKWWKKQNHGIVKFTASLETPARDEYDTVDNLFDEDCLKRWLPLYYRDRMALRNRTLFTEHEDGTLEINFFDEDEVPAVPTDQVPVKKLPRPVAGMPCYYIYLNPGIIEFNLAVGRRDMLQIRFQLRQLNEDPDIQARLKQQVLDFADQFLQTVTIDLSTRETKLLHNEPR